MFVLIPSYKETGKVAQKLATLQKRWISILANHLPREDSILDISVPKMTNALPTAAMAPPQAAAVFQLSLGLFGILTTALFGVLTMVLVVMTF